jgi:hypothetical protein
MRAKEVRSFVLPEETLTIPELGGDGVVKVRGIGFGRKMAIAVSEPAEDRAGLLLEAAVVDEDGEPVMDAEAWDAFAMFHEDRGFELLVAAKRVSGFNSADVKKD